MDNQKPTAVISTTSPQVSRVFTLTWSGDDAGHSGVAGYEVEVWANGGTTNLYTGPNTSIQHTVPTGGPYTFLVQATDQAGNPGDWSAKVILVTLTTPSITYVGPISPTNASTPALTGEFLLGTGGEVITSSLLVTVAGTPSHLRFKIYDLRLFSQQS